MSRIGKSPVPIPEGVKCELAGSKLIVKGPKGALEQSLSPAMHIDIADSEIRVSRPTEAREHRALHGLTRSLINNMVQGVTQGYQRRLVIEGVGYRASIQGQNLNLQVGYSHPVVVEPPEGISFEVEGTQTVMVRGIDKQAVGQAAADIRALRKPEPYKGKGIRYDTERIRRKVGKAGGK